MVGRPGRTQSIFTAGELDPGLHEDTGLKYFAKALKGALNCEVLPTGGIKRRDGMRQVGQVADDAARGFAFTASDGGVYDIVLAPETLDAWHGNEVVDTVAHAFAADQLADLTVAQQLDTALLFHAAVETQRLKVLAPTNWQVDAAPFANLPNYDYGGTYVNGVAAAWSLLFDGLTDGSSYFALTINGHETGSILYHSTLSSMLSDIDDRLAELPNLDPGYAVAVSGAVIIITFSGTGNEGDGWALSGRVINKADAAIIAFHITVGVVAGEPIISSDKGWPRCGCFFQQRLLIGGLASLPNAWMASRTGDFYNFDDRLAEANGAFLVPMDVAGGEAIRRMSAQRTVLIFTNQGEYWLSDRTIDKTKPPVHVLASPAGIAAGVPAVENEGAAVFCTANRGTIAEMRYTDIDGNFTTTPISIFSAHIIDDVVDMAIRRPSSDTDDGSLLVAVKADGTFALCKLLRAQDVTAWTPCSTDGLVKAVWVNGDNLIRMIVERESESGAARYLETLDPDYFLDGAIDCTVSPASATITGLDSHENRDVWAIAEGEVYGPYNVEGGAITIPKAVSSAIVGRFAPPVLETLPPARDIAPGTVLKRKGRIHTAGVSLLDSTSLALGANGVAPREVVMRRFGEAADVPELEAGFTGAQKAGWLPGYQEQPTLVLTQLRPGRFHVRSITTEARL